MPIKNIAEKVPRLKRSPIPDFNGAVIFCTILCCVIFAFKEVGIKTTITIAIPSVIETLCWNPEITRREPSKPKTAPKNE